MSGGTNRFALALPTAPSKFTPLLAWLPVLHPSQIGGPKAVKLGTETAAASTGPAIATASMKVAPNPVTAAPAAPAPKATAFTMDEDF